LAVASLYEKYGSQEEIDRLVYFTIICLRRFSKPKTVAEDTMGLCTGGLFSGFDMNELRNLMKSNESLRAGFWKIAKRASDELHERHRSDNSKFFPKNKDSEKEEWNYHFATSNGGVIKLNFFGRSGIFDVKDVFAFASINPDKNHRFFINYFYTNTDESFKWIIFYNSFFIDAFIIDDLILSISELLNTLLQEK
jgi:hypothetical protein